MGKREGRLARRTELGIRVVLEGLESSRPVETTHTQNVAPRGVRVITETPWRAREELLLRISHTGWRLRAKVIYCIPREDGKFEMGVAWITPSINWAELPPEAMAS